MVHYYKINRYNIEWYIGTFNCCFWQSRGEKCNLTESEAFWYRRQLRLHHFFFFFNRRRLWEGFHQHTKFILWGEAVSDAATTWKWHLDTLMSHWKSVPRRESRCNLLWLGEIPGNLCVFSLLFSAANFLYRSGIHTKKCNVKKKKPLCRR